MKSFVIALLAVVGLSASTAFALTVPPAPSARVNDYAGVLDATTKQQLEDQLRGYANGETSQYVVAVFPSLDGEALEDFSVRLAEAWKVGSKKISDGVLVSVFLAEKKIRIEVGYGLEDKLTDAFCARVIRDVIGPAAAHGELGAGLSQAFAAIDQQATGRDHVPPIRTRRTTPATQDGKLSGLVLFAILLIVIIVAARNNRGGGGGVGPFLGGWLLGSGGFGGGGGFSSGGGGFGGGGGFSGGGGSFGGGGASGGW
jgi:uncharacterized protein